MSNPNPLIPQGSLLEQQAKSKPHLRIALCIVAVHVIFLGGLLMQGCKREPTTAGNQDTLFTNDYALSAPLDTNMLYTPTNPPMSATQEPIAPVLTPQYSNLTPIVPETLAPVSPAQEYTVAKGDSFYSIGKKFGVTSGAIARANPGVDSTRLKVGQKLQIPAPSAAAQGALGAGAAAAGEVYTVKAGDTLTRIARNNGITVSALRELNGLRTDRIQVGQKLKLPPRNAPAESTAPAPLPGPGPGSSSSPIPQ